MHPAGDIRGNKSTSLSGKKIALCITGSIASVECVKLARELVRHGADVHGVMTKAAMEIVGPYSIEFATGNPVVTKLTGMVEHVSMCGDVEGRADLILVAPATANTIGKMVHGIDDTTVTTYLTTGIGTGIPVVVVPAMHNTMYDHPVVQDNIGKAKEMGISFVQPIMEESKAKMASIHQIREEVIRKLSGEELNGKKVLIVAGATSEPIDDMRFITNRASGRTGIHLATEAFRDGGDVLLLAGNNVVEIPDHIKTERFSSTSDLIEKISLLMNDHGIFDIAIFVAGISDYTPEGFDGKLSSETKEMILKLNKTPKVIEKYKRLYPDSILVGFKAESVGDEKELIRRAFKRLTDVSMEMIVANDLSDVSSDENTVLVITEDKEVFRAGGKKGSIARFIMDKCIELSRTRT